MKLEKFLSNKKLCSRRNFKKFIKKNHIYINDEQINKSINIFENDIVKVNEMEYKFNEKKYIYMNKPKGCVCANTDEYNY